TFSIFLCCFQSRKGFFLMCFNFSLKHGFLQVIMLLYLSQLTWRVGLRGGFPPEPWLEDAIHNPGAAVFTSD
ncbi:MAG: hypothetical protein KAV87_66880, partial [Desulfobacteraceae bacterium]|nr:hypothetical protein [Desulfobacteraceae bacterium]